LLVALVAVAALALPAGASATRFPGGHHNPVWELQQAMGDFRDAMSSAGRTIHEADDSVGELVTACFAAENIADPDAKALAWLYVKQDANIVLVDLFQNNVEQDLVRVGDRRRKIGKAADDLPPRRANLAHRGVVHLLEATNRFKEAVADDEAALAAIGQENCTLAFGKHDSFSSDWERARIPYHLAWSFLTDAVR